jgi:hypothetical protein
LAIERNFASLSFIARSAATWALMSMLAPTAPTISPVRCGWRRADQDRAPRAGRAEGLDLDDVAGTLRRASARATGHSSTPSRCPARGVAGRPPAFPFPVVVDVAGAGWSPQIAAVGLRSTSSRHSAST